MADPNAGREDPPAAARRLRTRRSARRRTSFMEGIRSGAIATRSGETYKPSSVRSYEQGLAGVTSCLTSADADWADVTAADLQALVERLRRQGPEREHHHQRLQPSASALSASGATRARDAQPLPRRQPADDPQPSESTPPIPGTRRGWSGCCAKGISARGRSRSTAGCGLESSGRCDGKTSTRRPGSSTSQRSWDAREGEIEPKSFAGRRDVPIIAALRPFLTAQRARCAWQPTGLALGSSKSVPFSYNGLYRRSAKAWEATGFPRVTPTRLAIASPRT